MRDLLSKLRSWKSGCGFITGVGSSGTPYDCSTGDRTSRTPVHPTIGLTLSSGGARGLAHIGVIQVLEENGITVDAVAGASMGAYVGACWTAGRSGAELEELASELRTGRDLFSLVDPVFPPRRGFIRGDRIENRLRKTLGSISFDDLQVPLSVVATELKSFRRAIFESGDVASAVRASLSVPGIVEPALRDGIEYIDGGVCDPLPVGILRKKSIDIVIAVSVIPALSELGISGAPNDVSLATAGEDAAPNAWRRSLSYVNRQVNYFADGNLFDILRSAAFGSQLRLAQSSAARADVLIRPTASGTGWHDYTAWKPCIESGRRAATAALPEIFDRIESYKARGGKPESLHHDPPERRRAISGTR